MRTYLLACRAAVATALLLGAATCWAGTWRHDGTESAHVNLAAEARYAGVGKMIFTSDAGSRWGCSGTLVAADWVLTAAHCIDEPGTASFTVGGSTYTSMQLVPHPSWTGDLSKGYDIGLMRIGGGSAVAPATLYSGSDEQGRIATSVGFGLGGTGLTGADGSNHPFGVKRAGHNVVDAFLHTGGNPLKAAQTSRVLLSDFDQPGNAAASSWGSSAPLELEYVIAPGDSGGGMFIDVSGTTYLAGVHSFIWGRIDSDPNSSYSDASGHTRVSQFVDWINSTMTGDGGSSGGGKGNGKGGGKPTLDLLAVAYPPGAQAAAVPEPSSIALAAGGLAFGLVTWFRRRRQVR